jgi:uncharacterized membrane protein
MTLNFGPKVLALLIGTIAISGCSVDRMSGQRTLTAGAAGAVGGAVIGIISGDFLASSLSGAAAGAASGFVYDQLSR